MKMFENARIIQNDGVLDVEVIERYIAETLNGVVDRQYENVTTNITFTEGELSTSDNISSVLWILGIAAGIIVLLLVVLIFKRNNKNKGN